MKKYIQVGVVFSTIVFATLLWLTRSEWLQSQSAFASKPNELWYWLMHISIMATFIWDGIENKRIQSYSVSIASALVLYFDMYNHSMLHNIATGLTLLFAFINIIVYRGNDKAIVPIFSTAGAIMVFIIGFLYDEVHLFLIEVIVEFVIAVSIIRRILNKPS